MHRQQLSPPSARPRSLQCRPDKLRPPLLAAPAALAALGARLPVVVVAPAVVAVVALPPAAPGRAVGGGGPWLAGARLAWGRRVSRRRFWPIWRAVAVALAAAAAAALATLGARLAVVLTAVAVAVAVPVVVVVAPVVSPPAAGYYNFSHISMVGSNMWIIFPAHPPNFMCQSDADGACTA